MCDDFFSKCLMIFLKITRHIVWWTRKKISNIVMGTHFSEICMKEWQFSYKITWKCLEAILSWPQCTAYEKHNFKKIINCRLSAEWRAMANLKEIALKLLVPDGSVEVESIPGKEKSADVGTWAAWRKEKGINLLTKNNLVCPESLDLPCQIDIF